MLARNFTQFDFPTLNPSDTLARAIQLFMDECVCHLPVVNEAMQLEGILSADIAYDVENRQQPVSLLRSDWLMAFVPPEMHMLETFQVLAKKGLSIVPVINEQGIYIGSITAKDFLTAMGDLHAFNAPGGIVVLRLGARDYNLQQISRIIELNNAKILMLYLNSDEAQQQLRVTMKLNTLDLAHILATFERYDYQVEYFYPINPNNDALSDRYQMLMRMFNL